MKTISIGAVALAVACSGKDAPPPTAAAPSTAPTPDARAFRPGAAAEAPGPPTTDAEFEALMNTGLQMFLAMGQAVDAAGDDCGALADRMDAIIDDNQAFIATASTLKNDPARYKKAEEWMQGKMDALMPTMLKLGTAGQQCAADARFAAVMKRMEALQ